MAMSQLSHYSKDFWLTNIANNSSHFFDKLTTYLHYHLLLLTEHLLCAKHYWTLAMNQTFYFVCFFFYYIKHFMYTILNIHNNAMKSISSFSLVYN